MVKVGYCGNHDGDECKGTHYLWTYWNVSIDWTDWSCSDEELQEQVNFTLSKNGSDDDIGTEIFGSSEFIIGPFSFNSSKDVTRENYAVQILDGNGNIVNGFATCDRNGQPITLQGSRK